MAHRLICYKIHLQDIRLAIDIKVVLINKDIDHLGNYIISFFRLIYLMLDTAFKRDRKIGKYRSIDIL